MLNDSQIRGYLDRIGIDDVPEPTLESLNQLIYANQSHIPFETVILHRSGNAPSLDTDDLYDKLIARRLGGYCFELNKLFEELLLGLGFDAKPVLCRSVRGREERMPINHRGTIVNIGGHSYSADVGFGGPMPAGALSLETNDEQDVMGDTYSIEPAGDSWLKVVRLTGGPQDLYDDERPIQKQVELEICTTPVEDQDFESLNAFFSQPGTYFRDHETVNLRTSDGYLGYRDGVLTVRKNGTKTIENIAPENVDEALLEYFGMRLS